MDSLDTYMYYIDFGNPIAFARMKKRKRISRTIALLFSLCARISFKTICVYAIIECDIDEFIYIYRGIYT